jgi:type II secretion system protein C
MNLEGDVQAIMSAKPRIIKASPEPGGTETAEIDLDSIVTNNGGKYVVDRQKFNALLTPPSRLANDIKFIPNSKEGKAYGLKISYLKNNTFFGKVGLKSGDVLINANKKDVNSVEDSFQVYQMFKNEDHLSMQVERDGQIVDIPIEFR